MDDQVAAVAYNGVYPTRINIRNGLYDFYSAAQLYTNPTAHAAVNALAEDMLTFAAKPENIPATKVNFWASAKEMSFVKGNDKTYPVWVTGPTMTP
jgi:hypothetical protein